MRQESLAYTPDHWAVPLDKSCEGSFIPMFDEAGKELPIGQPGPVLQKHFAEAMDDLGGRVLRHFFAQRVSLLLYLLFAAGRYFDALFSDRKVMKGCSFVHKRLLRSQTTYQMLMGMPRVTSEVEQSADAVEEALVRAEILADSVIGESGRGVYESSSVPHPACLEFEDDH